MCSFPWSVVARAIALMHIVPCHSLSGLLTPRPPLFSTCVSIVVADYSGFGSSAAFGASTGADSAGFASGSALVRMRAASWAKEWTGALPAFC